MEEILNKIVSKLDSLEKGQNELIMDVSGLKTDVSSLITDVSGLKTDVSGLKTDVSGLKTDVSGLKTDVSGLKTDVSSLKSEVSCLKSDMKSGFDLVNKKLDTIYAQVAHNTEQEVRLNEVVSRVDQLETDVKVIKKAISNQ